MSKAILQPVADYIREKLREKLIAQDHVATKRLYNSIDVAVEETVSGWKLVGSNLFYGNIQDRGLRPGVYVPIPALIAWIRAKRINLRGKKELSVAFAIRQSIYRNGTPTDGNPNKKRWISSTLEEEESEIQRRIQQALAIEVQLLFQNMIEKTQKTIQ